MPQKNWFIHIEGQSLGPLPTNIVSIMLKQGRLQVSDFVWGEGLTRWERIGDLEAFAAFTPPYPTAPIPSAPGTVAPADALRVEPRPASSPAPTPTPTSALAPAAAPRQELRPAPLDPAKTIEAPRPPLEASKPKVRILPRVPLEGIANLMGFGAHPIVDISIGGMLVVGLEPIPVGTNVKFTLESPLLDRVVEMTGVVVRLVDRPNNKSGIGIEFTRVNPAYKRFLQDYVNSKLPPEQM